jgi:hypothetical protein
MARLQGVHSALGRREGHKLHLDNRLMLANLKVAISVGWDHGEFGGNDLLKPVLKIWPLCNRGSNAA